MAKAFDLVETNPFTTYTFGELDTQRPGFTFNPDWKSDFDFDVSGLDLSQPVMRKAAISDVFTYSPTPAKTTPGAINNTNAILGDYLSGLKQKASKDMFWGATMKTAAAAGELFSNLATYGTNMNNANRQAQNTKLQASVQMQALDNQILYYKNQITDRFNTLMARNTVTMAAKNLRVSAGALLEQTKDAAYDATKDIQTMESNAELKKIALRFEQKQADITKKLQKSLYTTNLINSAAKLGLMVSTGGGTMESWGDLYSNAFGSGSLNKTVYGG